MLRVVPLRSARNGAPTWLTSRKRAVINGYPQNPGPAERSGLVFLARGIAAELYIGILGFARLAYLREREPARRTGSEQGTKKARPSFWRTEGRLLCR